MIVKKIAFTLLFAMLSLGATAQSAKNVLEIDQASFRPVQTGALAGVGIDKIAPDRSKRPCARIKLHVNRMTREEIDELVVRPIGGMVELTKKTTAVEGNGLIFELTAKEQVRFYLHHDKYGDSNEVAVNLEANKEYYLDAQLNLLLSIAVASNVKGADVYIDEAYKGQTGDNYMLTIEGITPGEHKIKIQHGAATAEQTVNVNSSNISFRVEVNDNTAQPQYVLFEVEPKFAIVFIDNEPQTTQEGYAQAVLQNGTYSWRVMAKGYYEQSGTFTVSGEKVTRKVTLKADGAMVTISAGEGAEIWVNNELKGQSPWRGLLLSGTYIFEARRAGHRTTRLSQTITSATAEQSYTLDAPTPIVGILNATSVPADADVYVDGKLVGQTPLFTDMLEGKHKVSIKKNGYQLFEQDATILENKTTNIVAMLNNATEDTPTKTINEILQDSKNVLSKTNDAYTLHANSIENRIVKYTTTDNKIASGKSPFKDGSFPLPKYSESHTYGKIILKENTTSFTAFLFYGWSTLKSIHIPNSIKSIEKFAFLGCDRLKNVYCYSQTPPTLAEYNSEVRNSRIYVPHNAVEAYKSSKDWKDCNITGFDPNSASSSTYTVGSNLRSSITKSTQVSAPVVVSGPTPGPYKVGDYYNENGKEGVVFWVDETGQHGKIVSLTESKNALQWASVKIEQKRLIGADDKENGANNMAKVRQIYDWQGKYPAFKWCADLGEDWYLPAIEELKLFTSNHTVRNAINQTLATKGGTKIPDIGTYHWYWSSTEHNHKYGEEFCAWFVGMGNGYTDNSYKYNGSYVRAVSAF